MHQRATCIATVTETKSARFNLRIQIRFTRHTVERLVWSPITGRHIPYPEFIEFNHPPLPLSVVLGDAMPFEVLIVIGPVDGDQWKPFPQNYPGIAEATQRPHGVKDHGGSARVLMTRYESVKVGVDAKGCHT